MSDYIAYIDIAHIDIGRLVTFDDTSRFLANPGERANEDSITGRFG